MVAINAITRESMNMIVDEIMNVMDSDYLSEESKGAEIERVLVNNGLAMVIEENDNEWISKNDELPNAYEEVKVLLDDGNITKDMIVRGKYGNLEWRDHADRFVKAWRKNANTLDDAIEEIFSRCIEDGIEINVDCAVLRDSDGNDIDD